MAIYHLHHVVPRHAGGTDDPSNLVRLTIEDHAKAHKILYEQHGRWQDEIAWKTLSGQISGAEARIQAVKRALSGKKQTPEHLAKRSNLGKKFGPLSEDHVNAIRERSKRLGMKAAIDASAKANLGSFWVTNGQNNMRIKAMEDIPIGWRKGRTFNPHSYRKVYEEHYESQQPALQ